MKTVDVIIPVYQGYDETFACIDSALASRAHNKTQMNIVVIDDCSPDIRITTELNERVKNQDFSLFHNSVNKGFVYTVNRGMTLSQNDIVLLNSDAEVARGWLDKLVEHSRCKRYKGKIASVTPFSNNATICSYPVFCAQNPLSAGETVESMDRYCELANKGQSIELPTAVGFCMYITRASLDELGLFDEEAFGRGYGEENDFCARAIKAGYHNIFALDTFSMHEGGVSFAETQESLQKNASKVLCDKHPEYDAWVADHVFHNPAQFFRTRIDLVRFYQSSLPLVLCVLHAHGGGTEKHVEDLANTLSGRVNVIALKTDEQGRFKLFAPARLEDFSLVFKRNQKPELLHLLASLNISRVHFHHLLGVDEDIVDLPKTLNVPYDFTAHDYYMMSKNVHIVGNEAKIDSIQIEKMKGFLSSASRLFAPSVDTCERLNKAFPSVIFFPVSHPDSIIEGKAFPEVSLDHPIRVLLVGGLGIEKGADVLTRAAAYVKANKLPIQFHLLGYTYHSLSTKPNLFIYGKFEQKDLGALIEEVNPHWFWFPTQTPETYSYTLSSALLTCRPVLASNLGAMPERLAHYGKARVIDWDSDVSKWCDAMLTYQFDEMVSQRKKADDFSVERYVSVITERDKVTFSPSIIEFAKFVENAEKFKFDWSVHGVKVIILKSLVWLKHHPFIAKVSRKVPVGIQLRVKNWLLGAK